MSASLADSPVESLRGVGPQLAVRLQKLGIRTIQDLWFHFPVRYEDRSQAVLIAQLQLGQSALIVVCIESADIIGSRRRMLSIQASDASGRVSLRFFHFGRWQQQHLVPGVLLACFGEARWSAYGWEMIHPDCDLLDSSATPLPQGYIPVYPLTQGVYQKTLRSLMKQALQRLAEAEQTSATMERLEYLPEEVLTHLQLPALQQAIQAIHAPAADQLGPDSDQTGTAARQRVAFEELLAHHLSLSRSSQKNVARPGPLLAVETPLMQQFLQSLPFDLTSAQKRVIAEIAADCTTGKPMRRLLQGDVGSGKTIVAACAALSALAAGYQVALMVPTELLAEQHAGNFTRWLEPLGIQVACLSAQSKGQQRAALLEQMRQGHTGVAIGTHALFQEQVGFARLGLVMIDEQHRFGVDQRLALLEKGCKDGLYPHQLIMTATPIPRTLAMLSFSELQVSVIDELPPGRVAVTTSVIPAERRDDVIARIAGWTASGRQTYWVCTLIDESELLQCEAAEDTAGLLSQALPQVRIALVHGRMKPIEKEQVMQAFKAHQIDLLVATTVIEVGVDVPNAGLMIVENAERLGLSQLHQLRGRVGRGGGSSFCVLMYRAPLSHTAHERLSILRASTDGFEIAERDLEMRGPGEFMGTRQAGEMQFRVADLSRDKDLLPAVLKTAGVLEQRYPECIAPLIQRWLGESAQYAEV